MRLHETLPYAADPQAVHAVLVDPAFHEEVGRETHASAVAVEVTSDAAGGETVTTRRTLPTTEAPEAVRRFVGSGVEVTQTTVWGPAAPDGSRRGRVQVRIEGVPLTADGDVALLPQGGGTVYDVDADVDCRIPLVGRRVVDAATPLIVGALRAEHAVGVRRLARG